jgi:hypothetical protein
MKSTRKENFLEVAKSGNLAVKPYFPLIWCFFGGFLFKLGTRFRGSYAEWDSVFCFVVSPEVL